jgi:hypothetical protein
MKKGQVGNTVRNETTDLIAIERTSDIASGYLLTKLNYLSPYIHRNVI